MGREPTIRKSRVRRFAWFLLASAALISAVVVVSGLVVSRFFERHVLSHEAEHTAKVVELHALHRRLAAFDFELPRAWIEREVFEAFLRELPGVIRIKVYDKTGRIIWADEPRLIGMTFPDNPYVAKALKGKVATVLHIPEEAEHLYEGTAGYLAEAYVPITVRASTGVVGVIATYTDATQVVQGIRRTQVLIWLFTGGMGLLLYVALAFVAWSAALNELRAMSRLEARNRELMLVQQFTKSVLQPLDLDRLAVNVVESAGPELGLSHVSLYRVGPGNALALLAGWPGSGPVSEVPAQELISQAIEARREVIRGATVTFPTFTPKGTAYVLLAAFKQVVSGPDLPAVRILEIMLHEAAIALANVELFTEIRQAHERLAAILAGIADPMMIVDRQMYIVWMNGAAAESVGGEGLGLPCFQVIRAEPEACESCPAIRTFFSGKVERGVMAQRRPDGQIRYRDLVTAPLRDASGQVHQVLEVARDITELVEMEEQLKQSAARLEESHAALLAKTEELERANQALQQAQAQLVEKERLAAAGEVVVGLHHAILNPLSGILGALQVLKEEGIAQPEKSQALAEAEAEIRKIEQLIRRLPALRRAAGIPYVGDTSMLDLERSSGAEEGG